MENIFGHEQLNAYKQAIQFEAWVTLVIKDRPDLAKAFEELRWVSSLISLKIAEGNAKLSSNDRFALFDVAIDSAVESAVLLDILEAEGELSTEQNLKGKSILKGIVEEISKLRNNG